MSTILSIFRQPLLHFLVLGGLVFAAFYYIEGTEPAPPQDDIAIDRATAERLAAGFTQAWRRKPTEMELSALIDDHIREEVLVREARDFALDQNDVVIRRRLRQKMEFLAESAVAAQQPSEQELNAFYQANAGRFSKDARLAIEQVYVGETADEETIETLLTALQAGQDFTSLGKRSLLPVTVPLAPPTAIDGTFGPGFAAVLLNQEQGVWIGPLRSGFGHHLVRITDRQDATLPPLADIRDQVIRDWRRDRADALAEQEFARMLSRYTVTRPDPADTADLVQ